MKCLTLAPELAHIELVHIADHRNTKFFTHLTGDLHRLIQIQVAFNTHTLNQVDDVFRSDHTAGIGNKRTSAQTADTAVKTGNDAGQYTYWSARNRQCHGDDNPGSLQEPGPVPHPGTFRYLPGCLSHRYPPAR